MKIIAGVDEVGRGSLIGPVYVAAVILNENIDIFLLKDSKKISYKKRIQLSKYIKANSSFAIGKASVKEIEEKNKLRKTRHSRKKEVRERVKFF